MLGHIHDLVGFCPMIDCYIYLSLIVSCTGERLPGTHEMSTSKSLQSVTNDIDLTETGSKKGSYKIQSGEKLQQPAQGYFICIVWCSFMPLVILNQ